MQKKVFAILNKMITCYFEKGNKANNTSLRHAVVDVLVIKQNKVLLEKRSEELLEGGKWALVGGFVEMDETVIDAVKRETFEETGYRVENIQMLTIRDNPDRPHEDRQNISFVFFCHALEKEGKSDWEVDKQKWYAFDELPPRDEIAFDHYKNIELYLRYKENNLTLPIL